MTNPSENSPSFDWPRRLPWLIFFFAFALRLIGSGWGLPSKDQNWPYHPDEAVNLLYARQINIGAGDFDPGFYNYGTLYLTLSSVADRVASAYAPTPENPSRTDLAMAEGRSIFACRLINVVAGAATALLAFLMLRRWQGPLASALGAMLIAVAPGHVVHSRFMTVDVLATFLFAASLLCALKLLPAPYDSETGGEIKDDSWKWTILAGLFAGLSAGTKYNGILVLVAVFVALAVARPKNSLVKAVAALGTSVLAFLVATPGALINPVKFRADLAYELAHSRSGHGLVFEGMPPSAMVHLTNLLVGIGLIATLLSLAGLVWGAKERAAPILVVSAVMFIFFLMLARAELAFLRYTFPLYIGLAFGMGWFVGRIQSNEKLAKAFTAAAMLGIGGLPFGDSLMAAGRYTVAMAGLDSRDAVIRYFQSLKSKEPVQVGIVADPWFYSPPFFPEANAPRFVPEEFRAQGMMEGPFSSPARPIQYVAADGSRHDWDIRLLTETKPEYVVFSSFEMMDLERLRYAKNLRPEVAAQVDRYKGFIEKLDTDYAPEFFAGFPSWSVHDMEYIRPQIWIWKRKAKP